VTAQTPAALDRFVELQSTNYRLFSDRDTDAPARRLAALERAHRQFFRVFEARGFTLQPPTGPLDAVVFHDGSAMAKFARDNDRTRNNWRHGYYTSRTNRIVLRLERRRVSDGAVEDDRLTGRALACTLHEAAHQLAFNTGLQQRGRAYPLWLSEGLACGFEAEDPDADFGPHLVHRYRLADFRFALRRGDIEPLGRFIGRRTLPEGGDAKRAVYAQSWALFHFLFNHEPEALNKYMRRLARGAKTAEFPRIFEEAFGDVDEVERRFLDAMREAAEKTFESSRLHDAKLAASDPASGR